MLSLQDFLFFFFAVKHYSSCFCLSDTPSNREEEVISEMKVSLAAVGSCRLFVHNATWFGALNDLLPPRWQNLVFPVTRHHVLETVKSWAVTEAVGDDREREREFKLPCFCFFLEEGGGLTDKQAERQADRQLLTQLQIRPGVSAKPGGG